MQLPRCWQDSKPCGTTAGRWWQLLDRNAIPALLSVPDSTLLLLQSGIPPPDLPRALLLIGVGHSSHPLYSTHGLLRVSSWASATPQTSCLTLIPHC